MQKGALPQSPQNATNSHRLPTSFSITLCFSPSFFPHVLTSPLHCFSQHSFSHLEAIQRGEQGVKMEREAKEMASRKQGSSGAAVSPCAACKLLRRRCVQDCIFAPYFPADEPQKFATVHKVFGASNVSKLLQELSVVQRSDAVSSLVYEANARVRDPVYGCVASISSLQRQINLLHAQLALAQAEIVHLHLQHAALFACSSTVAMTPLCSDATASANTSQSVIESGNINEKTLFSIEMLLDHPNIGLPMWSC